jgi:predicted PurR-regulated permease PerM
MAMRQAYDQKKSLIALSLLACGAAAFIYVLMAPFLQPIFFAFVLAIAFQPIYQWVSRRTRKPALAALITTLLLLLLVLAPMAMLGITIAREARDLYQHLAAESAIKGGWTSYFTAMADAPLQWAASKTGMPVPDIEAAALEKVQSWSSLVMAWGGSLLGNLTSTIGNGVISLFVLFFLFVEGHAIHKGITDWMPLPRERTRELLKTIADAIIANVYGIAAVGAAQGALTGLGFWFTGLASPVLWGAIAAFCSLVPLAGTALVWGPGILVLLAHGSWGKALFLLLWGVFAVSMSDNFVRPWVLSGRTEMNTLVVFFSLMGGMQAFGFIGIFAGPVIFSVAIAVFRILREEYLAPAQVPAPE